jgi:tetratricopeptide (TPR) repeat protein
MTKEAIETYEKVLAIESDDACATAAIHWNTGLAYEKKGDYATAIKHMDHYVLYLRHEGQNRQAEKYAERASRVRAKLEMPGGKQ